MPCSSICEVPSILLPLSIYRGGGTSNVFFDAEPESESSGDGVRLGVDPSTVRRVAPGTRSQASSHRILWFADMGRVLDPGRPGRLARFSQDECVGWGRPSLPRSIT